MAEEPRISGGIRLFKIAGITVFLHWWWFILLAYDLRGGFRLGDAEPYNWFGWHIAEYLCIFLIILLHEFGHALACRSVGGSADRILLWPLGGVAFVRPPPRPAAVLWSIAAGPLVNVALIPVGLTALHLVNGWPGAPPDVLEFVSSMARLNLILLAFNMLPIYPLDGGQILQALLWFVIGRIWSLRVAAVIGVLGALGVAGLGFYSRDTWLIVLAAFGGWQSVNGIRQAAQLSKIAKMPRHQGFACPSCHVAPLQGEFWRCACGESFDIFAPENEFACPACGRKVGQTQCVDCGQKSDITQWKPPNWSAGGNNMTSPLLPSPGTPGEG